MGHRALPVFETLSASRSSDLSAWLNLAAFNGLWLVVVLSAYTGRDALGVLAVAAWLPFHFANSRCAMADARLLLAALLLGPLIDTALVQWQWVDYHGRAVPGWPPLWIYALWANFALTLNHSLRWLQGRYGLAALLGALFAPVAYYNGAQLGAASIAAPAWRALLLVGLAWALWLPLLVRLSAGSRRDDLYLNA